MGRQILADPGWIAWILTFSLGLGVACTVIACLDGEDAKEMLVAFLFGAVFGAVLGFFTGGV